VRDIDCVAAKGTHARARAHTHTHTTHECILLTIRLPTPLAHAGEAGVGRVAAQEGGGGAGEAACGRDGGGGALETG
jgi:hypothetical protein